MGASKILKNAKQKVMIVNVSREQLYDLISEGCTPNGDNMISVFPNIYTEGDGCIVHDNGNIQLTGEAVVTLFKEDSYWDNNIKLILK